MISPPRALLLATFSALMASSSFAPAAPEGTAKEIPEPLQPWKGWAIWEDADRACPSPYQDPAKRLCFWPSRLALQVDSASGRFDLGVSVFNETWIPLPGGRDVWPVKVKADGVLLAVVEHDGRPSVNCPRETIASRVNSDGMQFPKACLSRERSAY
jgi:hypothetical protein